MPCEGGETSVQWGNLWNVLNSSDMIRFSYALEKNHLWLFMHIRLMLNKTSEETIAKTQMKNEGAQTKVVDLGPERDVEPLTGLNYFQLMSPLVTLSFMYNLNVRTRAVFQLTDVLNL